VSVQAIINELKADKGAWHGHEMVLHGVTARRGVADLGDEELAAAMELTVSKALTLISEVAALFIKALDARFPAPSLAVLQHFDVMHPSRFPAPSATVADTYGDKEVAAIAAFYGEERAIGPAEEGLMAVPLLDGEQLQSQWEQLRPWLLQQAAQYKAEKQLGLLQPPVFYKYVLSVHHRTCPDLAKVLQIMLVLQASTAEVERGFSVMNDIKTPQRSSLAVETVDALMRVPLCGAPLGKAERVIVKAHKVWVHGRVPQRSSSRSRLRQRQGQESGEGVTDPVTGIVLHV